MDNQTLINSINEIAKRVHQTAKDKGWWEAPRNPLEMMALVHSEVSEAVEELRNNKPDSYRNDFNPEKPEGWAVELIDAVIRIFDFLECAKVDVGSILLEKMAYNETREYRHGGKAY